MIVRVYAYEDGVQIVRDVTVDIYTKFTDKETADKYDCPYCLYYLGKSKGLCVCKVKSCPAEACGYDARTAPVIRSIAIA